MGASIGMVYLERGQFRSENVLMADGCSQHFLFLKFGCIKYTAYQMIQYWCQIIKLSLYFFFLQILVIIWDHRGSKTIKPRRTSLTS